MVRQLSPESLSGMKIRAGEHLAALVTSSFLGTAPRRVDAAGGVDLWYDLEDGRGRDVLGLPDDVTSAAFEVKSIGRTYREWESAINRVHREGEDASFCVDQFDRTDRQGGFRSTQAQQRLVERQHRAGIALLCRDIADGPVVVKRKPGLGAADGDDPHFCGLVGHGRLV